MPPAIAQEGLVGRSDAEPLVAVQIEDVLVEPAATDPIRESTAGFLIRVTGGDSRVFGLTQAAAADFGVGVVNAFEEYRKEKEKKSGRGEVENPRGRRLEDIARLAARGYTAEETTGRVKPPIKAEDVEPLVHAMGTMARLSHRHGDFDMSPLIEAVDWSAVRVRSNGEVKDHATGAAVVSAAVTDLALGHQEAEQTAADTSDQKETEAEELICEAAEMFLDITVGDKRVAGLTQEMAQEISIKLINAYSESGLNTTIGKGGTKNKEEKIRKQEEIIRLAVSGLSTDEIRERMSIAVSTEEVTNLVEVLAERIKKARMKELLPDLDNIINEIDWSVVPAEPDAMGQLLDGGAQTERKSNRFIGRKLRDKEKAKLTEALHKVKLPIRVDGTEVEVSGWECSVLTVLSAAEINKGSKKPMTLHELFCKYADKVHHRSVDMEVRRPLAGALFGLVRRFEQEDGSNKLFEIAAKDSYLTFVLRPGVDLEGVPELPKVAAASASGSGEPELKEHPEPEF